MANKKTKPKNARKDWDALKLRYFKSDIMDVKPFFLSIGEKWSGTSSLRSKGWAQEKAIFMENINQEATEEVKQNLVDQRAMVLSNMEQAKIQGLNELAVRLNQNVKTMTVGTI